MKNKRTNTTTLHVFLLLMALAAPVNAQQTRVEAIEQEVADKAKALQPYTPGRLERTMLFVEEHNLLRRLSGRPPGWYPRLGGLSTGSGFALGPGYRNYFGRDGDIQISGAASLKSYWAATATIRTPSFAGHRVAIEVRGDYQYSPEERYFGTGSDSRAEDRVSYLVEASSISAGLLLRPHSAVRGGVRLGYRTALNGEGSGSFPSIETVFSPAETPALGASLDYLTATAFLEFDYRDVPGNPRGGGYHRVLWSRHDEREQKGYAFRRLDAELMHLLPFFDKRRVIALRAVGSFTDPDAGNEVPFFMLPFVGGPETLRGFRERRFTDRNLVLLQAEYRYEIFAALDMALFVDAGNVAPRVRDFTLRELKTDYGIGFRFGTRENVILRFDVGFGGEGTRYFVKFGPAF